MNKLVAHVCIRNTNDEILLIRRKKMKNNQENHQALKWDFPGGQVNPYEFPKEAAKREAKEEVALNIEIGDVLFEWSEFDQEKEIILTTLIYSSKPVGSEIMILLDLNKHDQYKWIAREDLLRLDDSPKLVNYIIPAVQRIL